MDIGSFKAFCTVVETGSISKAAKKMFITQPALSVKIQGLEKYFKEKLFERTNKGIKPTEAGMLVYSQGQKIIAILDNIEKEIERSKSPAKELLVGAATTIGNYALPCTVYIFSERHADYKISLDINKTDNIIERLLNRALEMGLVEGPIPESVRKTLIQEGISSRIIAHNDLFLIVPNNESFADVESITVDELKKLPLIVREKGSGIRRTVEVALAEKGLDFSDFKIAMEVNTTNAIKSAVESGKGVSLLPKMAMRKELHYKMMKAIRIKDLNFRHNFTLLYHKMETDRPPYSTFLKFLQSKDRGFC
jgi:LysR family transcriptional regulator, transcriptional activator of the cysJI operon